MAGGIATKPWFIATMVVVALVVAAGRVIKSIY
jgi:hypothetical protein